MQKRIILASIALVFLAVGCNKTKECKCETTQEWQNIGEPMTTQTQVTIDKGDCTDMNATQTMNAGGDTYVMHTECTEM